jgi:hypothetical protein
MPKNDTVPEIPTFQAWSKLLIMEKSGKLVCKM